MMKQNILSEVMNIGRVKALMGILKLSDEEAYNHCIDVAKITEFYLEKEMAIDYNKRTSDERRSIIMGAALHDIGKAFLPFGLQYSKKLFSDIEAEIMRTHPILGSVAIQNCEFDEIVNNIVLMHHANADGTGYPRINNRAYGIVSEDHPDVAIDVPEYVWIVAYADKLDAMISQRLFKRQKTLNEAWKVLVNMAKQGELPYDILNIYKDIIMDMDIFKGDKNDYT